MRLSEIQALKRLIRPTPHSWSEGRRCSIRSVHALARRRSASRQEASGRPAEVEERDQNASRPERCVRERASRRGVARRQSSMRKAVRKGRGLPEELKNQRAGLADGCG
jgi:hypothetical protein